MGDLIDRKTAIDELKGLPTMVGLLDPEDAVSAIANLPSAQPEIIHCRECKHWKHSDVRKNYCEVFDWVNTAEDFCSFAERRTDE